MTKEQKILFLEQLATAIEIKHPTREDIRNLDVNLDQINEELSNRVSTNESNISSLSATVNDHGTEITNIKTDITNYKAGMDDKIASIAAKLGSRIGSASTYDGLPTVDQNGEPVSVGDTATLTATDGDHPAGLYEWDGTQWVLTIDYDAIDLTNIIANATATLEEVEAGVINNKFVTPYTLYASGALTQEDVNKATGVPLIKNGTFDDASDWTLVGSGLEGNTVIEDGVLKLRADSNGTTAKTIMSYAMDPSVDYRLKLTVVSDLDGRANALEARVKSEDGGTTYVTLTGFAVGDNDKTFTMTDNTDAKTFELYVTDVDHSLQIDDITLEKM